MLHDPGTVTPGPSDQPGLAGKVEGRSREEGVLDRVLADPAPDLVGVAHGGSYGVGGGLERGGFLAVGAFGASVGEVPGWP